MGDLADVYEQTRIHVSDLVGGLSDEEAERPVPATPGGESETSLPISAAI
jgi:hypothetical protein